MSSAPLIATENLVKRYGLGETVIRALDGVTLSIDPGEFVAIVGASGSGKSTLMNMLGGLDVPDSGEIRIAGTSFARMNQRQRAFFRNGTIGFVFQQFQLLPKKTALTNVRLPLQYRRPRLPDEVVRARRSLERVGLGDRMSHRPTQLSGGQQQRVAIARALVGDPKLLLADEPTGAVDSRTSAEIMKLLLELNQQGLTLVLITHDMQIANHASRVVTMRDGKVIKDTGASQIA
ncbi:MAG: ABC transporter ATP-binding protein [Henriciella sp.]|nr:ABC transporter ATP-binding protein [Henriciella sp.]